MIHQQDAIFILQQIIEPDLQKDLVSLNLVKEIIQIEGTLHLKIASLNPTLQAKKKLEQSIISAFEKTFPSEKVIVEMVHLPKDEQQPEHRKILAQIKKIIAIASGKGGVGKSTLTASLALSLQLSGYKVGILDVDIYGPSLPILLDVEFQKPSSREIDGKSWIVPIEKHGLELMSIGFFTDPSQAIAWRGPMASKAVGQMVKDVAWGNLDYLLIDLPPGTGDIHLSLLALLPLDGVVLVSTPQKMALADATRGLQMFQLPTLKTPILGMVENMSEFITETEQKNYFFGHGGVKDLAQSSGVPFLGEVPMFPELRLACDQGKLYELLRDNIEIRKIFEKIIQNIQI